MSPLTILPELPPIRLDADGSYRIGASRVLLPVLINAHHDWGWGAEQWAEQFPTITRSEAHAVMAYYLNHRAEVDAYVDEWNAEGDRQAEEAWSSPEGQALRAKLLAARAEKVKS